MKNQLYQNVYASYTVTPQSEELLKQFSREVISILQGYPMDEKPVFKVPSQFHITADYRGTVTDIDEYIATIKKRKKNGQQYIECDGVGTWKSNTNGNDIIYIIPTGEIPYEHNDIENTPHMTAVEMIKPDNLFLTRFWMCAITNVFDAWSELGGDGPFIPIGIDTKKIQIRGTQDEKKSILVEI